jgi:RNA polymerase sigma-70 factor (ECF subfamily)
VEGVRSASTRTRRPQITGRQFRVAEIRPPRDRTLWGILLLTRHFAFLMTYIGGGPEESGTARSSAGKEVLLDAFEVWYSREHARLVNTLLLATGDIHAAAECVDEAFARALEHWDRVSKMASPSGWTYKVALHHARRVARRSSIERYLHLRHQDRNEVPSPAGEIWHLLSQLSTRQREVVVLRHVADLKESEIGDVLGISRSTVSSTLADAHAQLGRILRAESKEEHDHV